MTTTPDDARGPRARGPLDPRVLGLAPALRRHLVVCAVLAAVVAAAVLAQAEAISRLLPRLVTGDTGAVAPLAGWLVLVAATRGAVAALTERSATSALISTRGVVRRRVLDVLARVRPDHRRDLAPARAAVLTTTALAALEPWVRAYLPGLTIAAVVPLAAGIRILGADPLSAVVIAVVVPLVPVFMVLIGRATEARAARQWDALQRLAGRFLDVLTGLPTLRLFGRADAQVERVRQVTDRYRRATVQTLRVAFLSALVLELLSTLSVALVAVSLGIRLSDGGVDLRTALVVLLLAPECFLPIRRVSAAFHAATAGVDAATEIDAALALPVRTDGSGSAPGTGSLGTGSLEAHGVSFADPARGVRLAPADVTVAPGELVAVLGPSGAGKTTLLHVLRGALRPDEGAVTLGGGHLHDLPLAQQARAVVWVPQHPGAIGTSVISSAALGSPEGPSTDAAALDALRAVGIEHLALRHPAALSGGELRRLATARALVHATNGAAILLLDEPTAQLDPAAADRVRTALRQVTASGVGVLVATHDPALAHAADRRVELTRPAPDRAAAPLPRPGSTARPRTVGAPVPDPVPGGSARDLLVAQAQQIPDGPTAPEGAGGALGWLWTSARPQRARLLGAQALGVLTEVCTIGLAGTAAWLIVRAGERPPFADLAIAAVGVRAFGVGKGVLRYAERLASHDATLRLLADLRATVVARLTRLAPTGLPADERGDLQARLVDDIDRLQDGFLRVLAPLTSTLVVGLGAAVLAALLDPAGGAVLGAAVLLAGLVLPGVTYATARGRGADQARARGRVTASVVDLAEHAEELVACGAEPEWRARVEADAALADRLDRRQLTSTAPVAAIAAAAPALAAAGAVAAAGAAGPGLSGPALGVLVLLPLAVLEMMGPLAAAGDVLAQVEAAAARVRALLHRPDPVAEPAAPAAAPERGDLDLDDVALAWPGHDPCVTGVDMHVHEGQRVVVTGPSGSGKSTVAAALVRFLEPTSGRYRVGGADAGAVGGDAVRHVVTWCQQNPWFADSTLADNLRIARPDATDDDLWRVLAVAHLDQWASDLPDGLDTRLERDADAMSGGERQRLALARALLGDRRAFVFDEPTAHLDAPTATAVLHDLLAATEDRAVVLIAHGEDAGEVRAAHRINLDLYRGIGASTRNSSD